MFVTYKSIVPIKHKSFVLDSCKCIMHIMLIFIEKSMKGATTGTED